MKYQVLDNNKPAVYGNWNKCDFDSFWEASEYAKAYFYPWLENRVIEVNKPIDYNGYGDTAEVKEIVEDC